MLFEALTGRLPFEGSVHEVLADKRRQAAPRVRSVCPQAPAELAELCDALLARESARRPDAEALRALLGPRANGRRHDRGAASSAATREAAQVVPGRLLAEVATRAASVPVRHA